MKVKGNDKNQPEPDETPKPPKRVVQVNPNRFQWFRHTCGSTTGIEFVGTNTVLPPSCPGNCQRQDALWVKIDGDFVPSATRG